MVKYFQERPFLGKNLVTANPDTADILLMYRMTVRKRGGEVKYNTAANVYETYRRMM